MYRVYWTNHFYYAADEFCSLDAALAYGKSKCFEFAVHCNGELVAAWSPIGGLRRY